MGLSRRLTAPFACLAFLCASHAIGQAPGPASKPPSSSENTPRTARIPGKATIEEFFGPSVMMQNRAALAQRQLSQKTNEESFRGLTLVHWYTDEGIPVEQTPEMIKLKQAADKIARLSKQSILIVPVNLKNVPFIATVPPPRADRRISFSADACL
jgi:hypothetical protein